MKVQDDETSTTFDVAKIFFRFISFCAVILGFFVAYKLLLQQFYNGPNETLVLLALWLVGSYIVIPQIHRIFSYFYGPNYFVGRAKSPSGMLSDPINLAFFGSKRKIHMAMQKAGWELAEPLRIGSILKMIYSVALRKSYPNAPVGNMYLFKKSQSFAYQQQIKGNPMKRHHIRFWRVPEGWRLPGGHKADWLAAATYDTRISMRWATGQIDHKIHEDVDQERDYVIKTLNKSGAVKELEVVKHFTDAYHDRNNGVDRIRTDGSLPFVHL